ncbi:MAG: prepilin-type N-terminal cleavage/methylation domain-containing protein [Polyangiales bacterium]
MTRRAAQSRHRRQQGMTLIEIIIVVVIMALSSAGISLSLGALSRANLKAGAGKLAGAMRYAYNRAVVQGSTVRVRFKVPGETFSIEEAHGGVLLASKKDKEKVGAASEQDRVADAVDPWAAAEARIKQPDKPSFGASPFGPLTNADGESLKRYANISLGRGVQFIKLIAAHEPEPRTRGEGAVHFFPGGRSEHAFIEIGDGRDGVYTIELNALTGRVRIHAEAYESGDTLGSADDQDASEVKAP